MLFATTSPEADRLLARELPDGAPKWMTGSCSPKGPRCPVLRRLREGAVGVDVWWLYGWSAKARLLAQLLLAQLPVV